MYHQNRQLILAVCFVLNDDVSLYENWLIWFYYILKLYRLVSREDRNYIINMTRKEESV